MTTAPQWPVARRRTGIGFVPTPVPATANGFTLPTRRKAPAPVPKTPAPVPAAPPASPTSAALAAARQGAEANRVLGAVATDAFTAKFNDTGKSLPPRQRRALATAPADALPPLPVKRPKVPQDGAGTVPATPLPTPVTDAALPPAQAPREAGQTIALRPPASSAIRDAAETRIRHLRGQVRQDCEALANTAKSLGRRIEAGETPRQSGEFTSIAHQLDQTCASLYELLRLVKCY